MTGTFVAAGMFALPASAAFGEGSVDMNTGPGTAFRQALLMPAPAPGYLGLQPYTVLYAYAQAGETIQLGSSATAGSSNILVYAPGTNLEGLAFPADPAFATDIFDCDTDDPGTGVIATRAQELAGPQPNVGGYAPCEFVAPASGLYPIIMSPPDPGVAGGGGATVDAPAQSAGNSIAMWDVTVRDAGAVARPGRVYSNNFSLATSSVNASGAEVFPYTRTGYEYQVNFFDQGGVNWVLRSDDMGVVDATTGERTFASFACGNDQPGNNACVFNNATLAPQARSYPLFVNRVDPLVLTGPGGLGALGFATAPIAPSSNPLAGAVFTGSGGQAGATNRGSGGTIAFSAPTQMAGLDYTIAIDTNRDGTFGNASDVVDETGDLAAGGSNTFAWNGLDAGGTAPACGDYQYQIRSSLAQVHFALTDVENSGGTQIQRLSLPTDPALGDPLAASYNNRDPFKNGYVVTNNPVPAVTNGTSGPGFNSWTDATGNTDYIDTWAQLPEVQTSGTLRLLCADVQVVKSATPSPATPGEDVTFRLAVTNNGADTASAVVATDDLPETVTFKSASQGCSEAASVVTCSLTSLAAGATHVFEIVASVPSSATQCIQNTATVTSSTPDPNLANNSSQICVPLVGRSGLVMSKAASTATVATGGQVMYTLVVRNNGPSDDPGVKVSDPLPAGLTLVAAEASQGSCTTSANTVSCDLGALKDEGSAQVLVTVNVTAASGCVTNVARAQGMREDPDADDNQASAQVCVPAVPPVLPPTFDLAVDKRANVSRPVVGQRVTYRVVVRNNGPGAAPEAKLTDTFNNRATVVSVRTTQGTCTRELPITCELGRIESGAGVTVTMVIEPLESGRQRNAASATSCCGTDGNPGNNMDAADVNVQKIALRLSKTVSRGTVRAGETFSYRIAVSNPSKGTARDVRVCDRLPSGVSFVRSAPSSRRSGSQRCWTINSLAAGKSRSFRVTARAAKGASGSKVNRATLRSPDIKPATARRPVRVVGALPGVTG